MTAGLSSDDYRFLGRAPKEAFWRRYADYTSFERPSAVVFCKDGAFRAYLSGIASARKDRTKTPLRYTLVMEGQARTPAAESLLFALAAFVGDLVHVKPGPLSPASLGEALDKTFPEEFVEAALSHLRDTDSKDTGPLAEVESRIEKAIAALPRDTHAADCHVRFFCGGRASESARATLVGYAERLLIDGEAGTILIVNLASRERSPSGKCRRNRGSRYRTSVGSFSGHSARSGISFWAAGPRTLSRRGGPTGRDLQNGCFQSGGQRCGAHC